jgi:hypothetical protein
MKFDFTLANLFADEENNALLTALREAARQDCWRELEKGEMELDEAIDDYLETTPKTSLVAEITSMLHEAGYEITKKKVPKG